MIAPLHDSPFVCRKVEIHLGDHDAVEHDVEDHSDQDWPVAAKRGE
jgi:hypothetical protein